MPASMRETFRLIDSSRVRQVASGDPGKLSEFLNSCAYRFGIVGLIRWDTSRTARWVPRMRPFGLSGKPGGRCWATGIDASHRPCCALAVSAAGPAEDGAERRPQAVVRRFRPAVNKVTTRRWRAPVGRVLLDPVVGKSVTHPRVDGASMPG
jgi:hypothetical protein